MNIVPDTDSPSERDQTLSLTKILRQCADVEALVAESSRRLPRITSAIKHRLETQAELSACTDALGSSEAIQTNMQAASAKLTDIVIELQREIRERELLNLRFAAAVEQEEARRYASLHDALTGMPNRALFHDRLEHGFAQAKRHGWLLALMFMDLDDFKEINDQYGHDVGDKVLQTVARRLLDNTRGDDTVSRHGGDEFLYLAMDIKSEGNITIIAEKILKEIKAPFYVNERDVATRLNIKASIGISIFPKNGEDAEALVASADRAMYRAKWNKCGYAFAQ